MFSTLKAVPQKEGYLGLYKGNGAMMVRIFPYGAIQFMAFDNYKKVKYHVCLDDSRRLWVFKILFCSLILRAFLLTDVL